MKDHGGYLVNEKYLGQCNHNTLGVVMDNIMDRDKHKPVVKIMRTENIELLAGSHTVAVFRIKNKSAALESSAGKTS